MVYGEPECVNIQVCLFFYTRLGFIFIFISYFGEVHAEGEFQLTRRPGVHSSFIFPHMTIVFFFSEQNQGPWAFRN